MRVILLTIATILVSDARAEENPLALIGSYVEASSAIDPYLYRVVIRNDSKADLTVRYLSISPEGQSARSIGASDPDVCWWRVIPPVLKPGTYGEVRIKMDRAGATLPAVRIQCADGAHLSAKLPVDPSPIHVQSVRYDAQEQAFIVYWRNANNIKNKMQQVYLDGELIAEDQVPKAEVDTGTQCFAVKLKDAPHVGSVHLLSLRTARGNTDFMFRVPGHFSLAFEGTGQEIFSSRKVSLQVNNVLGSTAVVGSVPRPATCLVASCLTHQPGQPRSNVWRMLRLQRQLLIADPCQSAVIHLCRLDLEEGFAMYGQSADGIRVNPYPYAVPGADVHNFSDAMKLLEDARVGAGIGGVHAVIPVESGTDNRVLPRTLLAIAAGCSGVLYRLPAAKSPEDSKNIISRIEAELQSVRDTLPLWNAVETLGPVICKETTVGGWLVQMGPRRLAVVLVSSTFTPIDREIVVSVNLPHGAAAQRILTFDGRELTKMKGAEKSLEMTIDRFRGGTVIFIELAKPTADAYGF